MNSRPAGVDGVDTASDHSQPTLSTESTMSTRVALSSNRSSFTSTRGYDAAGREGGGGTTDRSLGLDLLGLESVFQTGHGTRYFVEDQR